MADEDGLPAGSLSLEENPTIVGVTEKTEDPPPVVEDDDAPPQGTIDGSGGVKFVPLDAVIAERTGRKAATKENAELKTKLSAAEQKAAKYDELAGYVDQARPIIEAVRNRPDLVEAAKRPAAKVDAPKPMTDAEALEYAKDFDLFTPDGKEDVDRAQRIVAREMARSERAAQQAIAPFQANDAQRASDQMFTAVANLKDANGFTVDAGELRKVWAGVPPELSAKPDVAGILYRIAMGETVSSGKYKGIPPKDAPAPVLTTESIGGGARVPKELDAIGSKFAKAADMKPSEFAKQSERFKPGQANSLE